MSTPTLAAPSARSCALIAKRLPAPAGAARRRRTPGLRREEIAEACGASLTWIAWLEQGREVSPSAPLLARLAAALRLAPAERVYLFELAGKRDPEAPAGGEDDWPDALLGLPQRMTSLPTCSTPAGRRAPGTARGRAVRRLARRRQRPQPAAFSFSARRRRRG